MRTALEGLGIVFAAYALFWSGVWLGEHGIIRTWWPGRRR